MWLKLTKNARFAHVVHELVNLKSINKHKIEKKNQCLSNILKSRTRALDTPLP